MKKIGILFLSVLVLTGCTQNGQTVLFRSEEVRQQQATQKVQEAEALLSSLNKQVEDIQMQDRIQVVMKTSQGDITLELFTDKAPKTVQNFITLAQQDFYDGILFHRVIPEFMIQAGDPNTKSQPDNWDIHGTGGPGYTFEDEINDEKLIRGSLAMANAGPNTNGSQFFIVVANDTPWLDGRHTNFGRVLEGMDVVDAIVSVEANERDHPLQDVVITDIQILQ
jgi:cyclophilin family peptidyl-prolyl cis-trans isomerase